MQFREQFRGMNLGLFSQPAAGLDMAHQQQLVIGVDNFRHRQPGPLAKVAQHQPLKGQTTAFATDLGNQRAVIAEINRIDIGDTSTTHRQEIKWRSTDHPGYGFYYIPSHHQVFSKRPTFPR